MTVYTVVEISSPRLVDHNVPAETVIDVMKDLRMNREYGIAFKQSEEHILDKNFVCKHCAELLRHFLP